MKKPGPFVVLILAFAAAALALTVIFWPFIKDLRDPVYREQFSAWVTGLGIKGVAVLLGLQIVQIILAVIPGGPVELIAGAAYGALGGTAVCVLGCVIASSAVFLAVKKFGLPLIRRFFGEENIRSWKFLADSDRAARAVFIVFLIPGTPKDMLTWFAPLSGLPLHTFTAVSVFARIPAILTTAVMGDSMIQGNWVMFLSFFLVTALAGTAGLRFRRRILGAISTKKSKEPKMKKALTIAGSDCSGGAGIQADLKTFSAHGVFGMSAVVSVVAENTSRVIAVEDVSPQMVGQQIDAVYEDIGTDAVKIGMLSTGGLMKTVAAKLDQYRPANVVIDPVMYAKNGAPLMDPNAIDTLIKYILPRADLITPNIPEAEKIAGMKIADEKDMEQAAKLIIKMGCSQVLIKGGHSSGDALDLLYDGREFFRFSSPRINTKNTHGTGCTLSSAIAANLALGCPMKDAVERAKKYVTTAIEHSLPIGKGHGPTNHFYDLYLHGLRR
ncbi:MAG: bifunctional hydroxymethylpyrimidine kinase/phosphomethylpyrimidine kinase [Treponema sp.]|jgi:hydroxymethylpyrimidine/phosphomethylpyrimidine kinase|nr:bifunctional hydroxymethylpyrimidine kinase/phosphomethylpyrimidine kinase [Treponema sp.]